MIGIVHSQYGVVKDLHVYSGTRAAEVHAWVAFGQVVGGAWQNMAMAWRPEKIF